MHSGLEPKHKLPSPYRTCAVEQLLDCMAVKHVLEDLHAL